MEVNITTCLTQLPALNICSILADKFLQANQILKIFQHHTFHFLLIVPVPFSRCRQVLEKLLAYTQWQLHRPLWQVSLFSKVFLRNRDFQLETVKNNNKLLQKEEAPWSFSYCDTLTIDHQRQKANFFFWWKAHGTVCLDGLLKFNPWFI